MLSLMAVALSSLVPSPASALTLAKDGTSEYVIALCPDPIPAERTAASELQRYLKLATGAELPIIEGDAPAENVILVGGEPEGVGPDGIVIKTDGSVLTLTGTRPRGALYAVYTFLEDTVGVRWWSSTEESVPDVPTLETGDLNVVHTPKLRVREAFYRDAFVGEFAPKLKCNGHFERIPEEYGGHYSIIGWCHTFYRFLPPETYFDAHPEWYSEINGERRHERGQLCLTNDEMRAEMTKVVLERIRENPTAGMISVSQNDWHGRCECGPCKAVEEAEDSPAGLLVQFVNAVAEEVEKEFPDFLIETLAYQYTRKAPKTIKPRDNVVIRLCSIECNFAEPLETGPTNEQFKSDIEAWSGIADKLFIWDYVTNFGNLILPHPNHRVLAPNLRFFIRNSTIGLFEQGDSGSSCSDFPELRAWVLGHLMWDPDLDEAELADEFMRGYYGEAAGPLAQYIDLIDDAVEGTYLRCFMTDTSAWLDVATLNKANALFDAAAKAVAGDEALGVRIDRARMPLDHVWLARWHKLKREARADGLAFTGPEDPAVAAEAFIARAHAHDVGSYREGRPFGEYEPMLLGRFGDPADPPKEAAGLGEDDWVDIQQAEFRFAGMGNWVTVVDDEGASDGKAARMGGGHTNWAVQLSITKDLVEMGRVHLYVVARCDLKGGEGIAYQIGIYDSEAKAGVTVVQPKLEDATPEYVTLDLGVHDLSEDWYIWAAPPGDAEKIDAVYIDRIFLIKEPAEG